MFVAKVLALVGLASFVGGAVGAVATITLPFGAVLLLAGATIGTVALESRDLQGAAGPVPNPAGEAEVAIVQLLAPVARRAA
jgi:hypothetical protein